MSKIETRGETMIDHNAFGDWLVRNAKNIGFALLALFALAVVYWKVFGGGSSASENEYIQAANHFSQIERAALGEKIKTSDIDAPLKALAGLLNSYPEMQAKYDGPIAQTLLAIGENTKALPFAERLLDRQRPASIENYRTFGQIAVNLAKNDKPSAATLAQTLDNTSQDNPLLHSYNSIQLALLDPSIQRWTSLKDELNTPIMQIWSGLFQEGNTSLSDFISKEMSNLEKTSQ